VRSLVRLVVVERIEQLSDDSHRFGVDGSAKKRVEGGVLFSRHPIHKIVMQRALFQLTRDDGSVLMCDEEVDSRLASSIPLGCRLSNLHLHHCSVDAGAIALALIGNQTIRRLVVAQCGVVDAAPFAAFLSASTAVQKLSLAGNLIEDVSPFESAIATNRSLEVLVLDQNPIVSLKPLEEGWRRNFVLEDIELFEVARGWSDALNEIRERNRRIRWDQTT
jgi:hypothetical protein